MKKVLLIISILVFSNAALFSQSSKGVESSDYRVPFSKLKESKELFLNDQVNTRGKSVLEDEGGVYREYLRWRNFWEPRIAPDGTYESYSKSIFDYYNKNNTRTANKTMGNTDTWKELGPFTQPIPGLSSVGGGALGVGIIKDLVINRQNTNTLLAWSLAGGLYVSTNKGVNWTNTGSDIWQRSGCSSAAFSPVDVNTWYGCSNIGGSFYNNMIGYGGGVYRTTNAGVTWDLIGDQSKFTNDNSGTIINKIFIHPNDASIAFLATRNGLYRGNNVNSANLSSITWTLIHAGYIDDMVFRTNNSGTLIISTKSSSNVWTMEYTTNSGTSWTALPVLPPPSGSTEYMNIEVSDAAPNSIYLRQGISNSCNVYVYSFTTSSWQFKSAQSKQTGGPGFGVSNFNPNIIYIGQGAEFAKSTDGGSTFITHSRTPSATNQFHADEEAFVSAPSTCAACSSEVYIGTHGGVSYSNDNAVSIYAHCNGLGIANPLGSSSSATNPEKMMMGLDHDGSVLSSGVYGPTFVPTWATVYDGDGQDPLIDYSDPAYVWASAQNDPANGFPNVHNLSSSGGVANTYTPTVFLPSNDFGVHIYQNRVSPDIVYNREATNVNGSRYENLYRSDKRGISGGTKEQISDFENINLDVKGWPDGYDHEYWMFNVYPSKDANICYLDLSTNGSVGGGQQQWFGKLYKNSVMLSSATTVKNSWVEVPLPINPGTGTPYTYYHYLSVDALNPLILYMGYNANPNWHKAELYKVDCTNPLAPIYVNIAGDPASGGLPYVPINSVVTEKGSNGGIYVATDVGVFYSNNTMLDFTPSNNSQWVLLGTNLPHIPVRNLEINYVANKIRAATLGRGMWEHDLFCPSQGLLAFNNISMAPNFYEAQDITATSAQVSSNNNTTFRATNSITLYPNFTAAITTTGVAFSAFIHPCSSPGNSFKESQEIDSGDPMFETDDDEIRRPITTDGNIKFTYYPNPFTDHVHIDFFLEKSSNVMISVYNAYGQIVETIANGKYEEGEHDLNFENSTLTPGVYFIKINFGDNHYTKAILKTNSK